MVSRFFLKNTYLLALIFICFQLACVSQKKDKSIVIKTAQKNSAIIEAAQQTESYLPFLKDKKVALVTNQTSVIFKNSAKTEYTHLVDSLLSLNINIQKVFAPEHGFRGNADAGESVKNSVDTKTNLPIISLYGKNKKPTSKQLSNIDLVVFDIQDVGVRFYTYISTLHYVMEACAETDIPLIILDRPNPNAQYIDGPMLNPKYSSFVGKHPVPLVYGMTIGEYGNMINGQGWLANKIKCDLTVIPVKNYNHKMEYNLAIRPSPNLPNAQSIQLYPSLGFFEGTTINAGRGTEFQFQRYGAPWFPNVDFSYTPQPNFGSKYPKHQGKLCYGVDLSDVNKTKKVDPQWLIDAYNKTPNSETFFGNTFTIHAGSKILQQQIESGFSADKIRASWQKEISSFKKVRAKYLLYN